ncbi:hypothetical protein CYY_005206 [Polysphondylium violaceum]|uniref:NIPSNAP domain-containing protein n=1 Tax=Polysphondylium violaceum TaxID=133409 RepID=A0A8J4PUU9_9MYCE|nr:hypothetical protein CYY_005206 [Polysphondylium violaceum]
MSKLGTKVYELRTITVPREATKKAFEFFSSTKLPTPAGSKFIGAFGSTFENKPEFVAVWEHDSLDNPSLHQGESKAMEPLTKLGASEETVFLRSFPWIEPAFTNNAKPLLWEFRCYTLKAGQMANWAKVFQNGLEERKKYSSPAAIFYSEFGILNRIYHFWPYQNFENRFDVRNKALENPIWANTVRDTAPFLDEMKNTVLHRIDYKGDN